MSGLKALTRDVATPVTAILFLISTVTGLMLLLHWQAGQVRFAHEWLSVGLAAVAVWHVAKNWRPLAGYLRRRLPAASFVLGLAASVATIALTGTTANISPRAVFTGLSASSLEAAAPAFGLSAVEAAARLSERGYPASPGDTLDAIGRRAGTVGAEIATILAVMVPPHPSAPRAAH